MGKKLYSFLSVIMSPEEAFQLAYFCDAADQIVPDYVAVNATVAVNNPYLGWSGVVTYDIKTHQWYTSFLGVTVGYPSANSFSCTAGRLDPSSRSDNKCRKNFFEGNSTNFSCFYGIGGGFTYGWPGYSIEAGLGTPGISLNHNYVIPK